MADSSIAVTAGSGTNIHSSSRSYAGSTKHDQYTLPAEYDLPSYILTGTAVSIAVANDHILAIMAGASLNVRIRRIRIEQASNATTAGFTNFDIYRLTTAGTGGTAVTPAAFDTTDTAGATGRTLPAVKGTETTFLLRTTLIMRQAVLTTATQPEEMYEWVQLPNMKPIVIPAGTSNGLALKSSTASAGATVHVTFEFVETSF